MSQLVFLRQNSCINYDLKVLTVKMLFSLLSLIQLHLKKYYYLKLIFQTMCF